MPNSQDLSTRNQELVTVAIIMIILCITFTTWRVLFRWKVSSMWMRWSDWLIIFGTVDIHDKTLKPGLAKTDARQMLSVSGMAVTIACGMSGAGRLLRDPFWQPNAVDKMIYQNHLTFASQLLNVYGMWVVKLSICAYLLVLDFSRTYRYVVWVCTTSLFHDTKMTDDIRGPWYSLLYSTSYCQQHSTSGCADHLHHDGTHASRTNSAGLRWSA